MSRESGGEHLYGERKLEEKIVGILDSRTRDILFVKKRRGFDVSIRDLGFLDFSKASMASLDELVQTPLDDLGAINERLDVIGELVSDRKIRNRVSKISKVLATDYEPFYEQLGKFLRLEGDTFFTYFRDREVQGLRGMIGFFAENNLPTSFGREYYRTQILSDLATQYEGFMQSEDGKILLSFFRYMKRLDRKIKKIEEELRSQEPKEGRRDEQQGISYEQLRGLIDVEKLTQAKEALERAKPFSEVLFQYSQLANIAIQNNYVRPEVVAREENCLIIQGGKWDKLETRDGVVPNDTYLGGGTRVEVLEGVNSGGKTVDMKKTLYIAALALSGSWVPAEYARVSIRDKIILREKGTGDVISAFQRDCRSVNEAMPPKGEYWLIGLDETFTSTERKGGEALTYGLIQHVLDQGTSLLIMSSHYPPLSQSFVGDSRVAFNHFPFERRPSEREPGKMQVTFPYKKQMGPLQDYSYAIAVSSSLGFDEQVLAFAEQRLAQKKVR